jgi:hypothetical protein
MYPSQVYANLGWHMEGEGMIGDRKIGDLVIGNWEGFADLDRSTPGSAAPLRHAQGSGLRPAAGNDDKLRRGDSCAARPLNSTPNWDDLGCTHRKSTPIWDGIWRGRGSERIAKIAELPPHPGKSGPIWGPRTSTPASQKRLAGDPGLPPQPGKSGPIWGPRSCQRLAIENHQPRG